VTDQCRTRKPQGLDDTVLARWDALSASELVEAMSIDPDQSLSPEQTDSFERWLIGPRANAEAAPVVVSLTINVGNGGRAGRSR
jgi:hypothetical protein